MSSRWRWRGWLCFWPVTTPVPSPGVATWLTPAGVATCRALSCPNIPGFLLRWMSWWGFVSGVGGHAFAHSMRLCRACALPARYCVFSSHHRVLWSCKVVNCTLWLPKPWSSYGRAADPRQVYCVDILNTLRDALLLDVGHERYRVTFLVRVDVALNEVAMHAWLHCCLYLQLGIATGDV